MRYGPGPGHGLLALQPQGQGALYMYISMRIILGGIPINNSFKL